MVSEFILLFGWLNLAFLSEEKRKKVMKKAGLINHEAVEIFESGKNNNEYWDEAKLH